MEIDSANPDRVLVTIHGVVISVQRCADEVDGLRCGKPGTLSEATHASDRTKWWCAQHFPPFVEWVKAKRYASKPTAEAKAAAAGLRRQKDPEAEAERAALQADGSGPTADAPETPWLGGLDDPGMVPHPEDTEAP